jgi:RNA polymerase sigma-70 factor (ECF subfamily)
MTPKEEGKQRNALTVAHHDFEKGLNSYAFFKLNSHTVGEDLVQDTFLKTWSYLVKGGKVETMKAFLYHILNNLIIDEYRKRKNKNTSLEVLLENGFEPGIDESSRLFNKLDGRAALVLIKSLPITYQRVMKMRYIQDLSIPEMSLITGQSKNTVTVQIHRGLEKLKLLYNSK